MEQEGEIEGATELRNNVAGEKEKMLLPHIQFWKEVWYLDLGLNLLFFPPVMSCLRKNPPPQVSDRPGHKTLALRPCLLSWF